jgi:5'(3')-deoxyribonucleotidase
MTEEIWGKVIPRGESELQLKLLYEEGYDIYICTTTDYRNVRPKYEKVIKKYFPFIDWGHMIITSNKQMIMGDFIIDDAPHNLICGCQSHKILIDMPHNQDCDEEGIVRFSDWESIRNYIENN